MHSDHSAADSLYKLHIMQQSKFLNTFSILYSFRSNILKQIITSVWHKIHLKFDWPSSG